MKVSSLLIYHSSVGNVNGEAVVPYLLLVATAVIVVAGIVKVQSASSKGTTSGALLIWALLIGIGLIFWLVELRIH